MVYVKREVAERLAATAVEGISVAQAQEIIKAYVNALKVCQVCEGSGKFMAGRRVAVFVTDRRGDNLEERFIEPGSPVRCPRCGDGEVGGTDPDFVTWFCAMGFLVKRCEEARNDPSARAAHPQCGWRIMLPLDP